MARRLHAARTFRRGLSLLALCGAVLAASGCSRATPGPRVVLYCSVDETVAEEVIAAFEKETGIGVLARFDTEAGKTVGLVQRLRIEASKPAADVFWSGEIFHTIRLADEGLLDAYETAGDLPPRFADARGRWHGFALRARVLGYHTQRVSTPPDRIEDLLDPQWRGRIVMADPEFGTTAGHVASLFVHYGEARAEEILRGLKANGVRLVAGNSTAVRMVATGQADLCLTDTDDVYAARRNGWPVALKYLRHGEAGPLVIPNTAARIKDGPNAREARELLRFLLSPATETILATSISHNTPVRTQVAEKFPAYALPDPLPIDYALVAACLPAAIEHARRILR